MPVSPGFSRCSGERTATPKARYSELFVSVVAFRKWVMAEARSGASGDVNLTRSLFQGWSFLLRA